MNVTPNQKINRLNFDLIVQQLLNRKDVYGWDQSELEQISTLYRQFLYLCFKYPRKKIVPTYEIDMFWHQHILNTRKYESDCQKVFGKYIHHNVDDGPGNDKIFQETLKLILREFPESY
jgi:hypothetical protein